MIPSQPSENPSQSDWPTSQPSENPSISGQPSSIPSESPSESPSISAKPSSSVEPSSSLNPSISLSPSAPLVAADIVSVADLSTFTFTGITGWSFTPLRDIVVTELGFYDVDSSGLANDHTVGIFRSDTGISVVSAGVSASTTTTTLDGSVGQTYFKSVDATTLSAGVAYVIVSNYFGVDQVAYSSQSVVFGPDLVWNGYVYPSICCFGDTNIFGETYVTYTTGVPGNVGGNFRYY